MTWKEHSFYSHSTDAKLKYRWLVNSVKLMRRFNDGIMIFQIKFSEDTHEYCFSKSSF